MLCQNCHNRVANVHFTQEVNNNKIELYLCENCASEKSQFNIGSTFNISDFFSGFMSPSKAVPFVAPIQKESSCDVCGMTYNDFRDTGKLGCGNCYKIFGERLMPIIKRLHGNAEHVGKLPVKVNKKMKVNNELEILKENLNKAIQNEEYEKAAEIRDKIRNMEGAQ